MATLTQENVHWDPLSGVDSLTDLLSEICPVPVQGS